MRWAAALLLVFVLLLGTAAGLLYRGTSLGPFQGPAEQLLGRLLERPIDLGRNPHVQIGEKLRIELRDAAIANADWGADTPLLQLQQASAILDTRSLFGAQIVIEDIAAEGLQIALERSAEGNSNIPLLDGDDEEEPAEDATWETLPVIVERVRIRNARLTRHNHETDKQAELLVETLTGESRAGGQLTLAGNGSFQGRSWDLETQSTNLQSIARTAAFDLSVRLELPRLLLDASARAPRLDTLADLSLNIDASGQLSPMVTDLSPLLEADTPLSVRLRATDVDPGIDVELNVELPNLQLRAWGEISEPLRGDGAELQFTAMAPSLRAITEALALGETEDVPLELAGGIRRNGTLISLRNLSLRAGDHHIQGDVYLPEFPRSAGGQIDIRGEGPDFGIYQRLLERPISFPVPYTFSGSLRESSEPGGSQAIEVVTSRLRIGEDSFIVEGPIGDFPSYDNSELRFSAQGPDLDRVAKALGVTAPSFGYAANGTLIVDGSGDIRIPGIDIEIDALRLNVSGQLDGYPEFDEIDLQLRAETDSLAAAARSLELAKTPGDIPATFNARLTGSPAALSAGDLRLDAGGLAAASRRGGLHLRDSAISSDLELQIDLEDPGTLLGEMSVKNMPQGPFSAVLLPRLDDDMIDLTLRDFEASKGRGDGRLRISREFVIDDRLEIYADIELDEPADLLPEIANYTPPSKPVKLQAHTRQSGDQSVIELSVRATEEAELDVVATLPVDGVGRRQLDLRGSGTDLRAFGIHAVMPEQPLPFVIDGNVVEDGELLTVDLRNLEVAGTRAAGNASINPRAGDYAIALKIPQGRLGPWLRKDDDEEPLESTDPESTAEDDGRLIPDRRIPVEWLNRYRMNIRIDTGPLGIPDGLAPSLSLVDRLSIELQSGAREAQLDVHELISSRGNMIASVGLRREEDSVDIRSVVQIRNSPTGLRLSDGDDTSLPRTSLDAELTARGATTRELAATLTGPVLLQGSAGVLKDVNLGFATASFVDQLLNTLLPMVEKNSDLEVVCLVLGARAQDGIVELNPGFVLRSKAVDLTARGDIDLHNERLRIRFDNQARRGLGISAAGLVNPYVQITGTLSRPTLALDVASGAIAGSAAAATGGLSVVATTFYGRFLRRNPCQTAMKRWNEAEG